MKSEDGFSLVETMVGSMVGLILLTGVCATLVVSYKTGQNTANTANSLNDGRQALTQIERDLMKATVLEFCDANGEGTCLRTQWPEAGGTQSIVYQLDDSTLTRLDETAFAAGQADVSAIVSRKVANLEQQPNVKLFTCTASGVLLQVDIQLALRSQSSGDPNLRLNTTVRPRNAYGNNAFGGQQGVSGC